MIVSGESFAAFEKGLEEEPEVLPGLAALFELGVDPELAAISDRYIPGWAIGVMTGQLATLDEDAT